MTLISTNVFIGIDQYIQADLVHFIKRVTLLRKKKVSITSSNIPRFSTLLLQTVVFQTLAHQSVQLIIYSDDQILWLWQFTHSKSLMMPKNVVSSLDCRIQNIIPKNDVKLSN